MNVFRSPGTRVICASCRGAPKTTKATVSIASRGIKYRLLSTDTIAEKIEPEKNADELIAFEEALPNNYRPKQLSNKRLLQLSKQCNIHILLKRLTV